MAAHGLAKLWAALLLLVFQSFHVQASTWSAKLDHGKVLGFPSYSEAVALLDGFLGKYPQLLRRETIGKSLEGRPIHAYVLSAGADGLFDNQPEVLITSLVHAREPAGLTVLLYFMGHLLELNEQGDPDAAYVIQTRKLYFIPFVNPDGYVANEGIKVKSIRKNRRPGCLDETKSGVDLNRNFAFHWKAEFDPCNEEYQGKAPFSEPETQALKKLIEGHSFKHAVNFHSFGGMLTHPYNFGAKRLPAEDESVYTEIAEVFKWPKFGTALETVGYTASGESDDWMYHAHHIISMSPEVGPESGDFWPPINLVRGIDARNYDRTLYVVKKAGLELALQWDHMLASMAHVPDDVHKRMQKAGGFSSVLKLRLDNKGISRSAGQALNVAVSGATRANVNGKAARGLLVLHGQGEKAARPARLIFNGQNAQAAPVVAFQVQPLERRSKMSLEVILSAHLENDSPSRSLSLCAVETPKAEFPLPPGAPAVCQCIGPAAMPQATGTAPATFKSSTAAVMVRFAGADASTELEKLCSAAVALAATKLGEPKLAPLVPVVSSLAEDLPGLGAATSKEAAVASSGGMVVFLIAGIASVMGLCLVAQGCKRWRSSAAGDRPSAMEGEQVPSMQVSDLDVGDV